MMLVTVFRRVPAPIIGTVGVVHDRGFARLEESLDWLEASGRPVERFDPRTSPGEVLAREAVRSLLSTEGDRCLPLILVNDTLVSRGEYPSRTQLARAVGRSRRAVRLAVARQCAAIGAAAALGFEEELRLQTARAREMGISRQAVRQAREAGTSLLHVGAGARG